MTPTTPGSARLERLRAEFDQSFASAATTAPDDDLELLGFRTGGAAYAARLGEVAAVHGLRAVTRVPGRHPGFEGLVAVHGQLMAVFDLAVLVAAPGAATARRWVLVCRDDRQVGLAVDSVDGYLRLPRDRLAPIAGQEPLVGALTGDGEAGRAARLVVDLSQILATIRRAVGPSARVER